MYSFIQTTVINTSLDSSGKPLYYATTGKRDTFTIRRFGTFDKECILSMYHKPYSPSKNATFKFKVPSTLSKGEYRLSFKVYLEGSYPSDHINGSMEYSTPKNFDILVLQDNEAGSVIADRLKSMIAKYNFMDMGTSDFTSEVSGDTITFTMKRPSAWFKSVKLEKFVDNGSFMTITDYNKVDGTGTPEEVDGSLVSFPDLGFGTYEQLINSVMLPTDNNTSFMGVNAPIRPIVNGQYDQYIINYYKNRGVFGNSAVGQDVNSITQHVVWVIKGEKDQFEQSIKGFLGKTPNIFIDLESGKEGDALEVVTGPTTKKQKIHNVSEDDDLSK